MARSNASSDSAGKWLIGLGAVGVAAAIFWPKRSSGTAMPAAPPIPGSTTIPSTSIPNTMTPTSSSNTGASTPAATSANVRLQRDLRIIGYGSGATWGNIATDGVIGPLTNAAIAAYKTARGDATTRTLAQTMELARMEAISQGALHSQQALGGDPPTSGPIIDKLNVQLRTLGYADMAAYLRAHPLTFDGVNIVASSTDPAHRITMLNAVDRDYRMYVGLT